jgi:hypothetical protein
MARENRKFDVRHHALLGIDDLRAIIRHARIPRERAAEFWERVFEIVQEFTQLPRADETVYGFVAGLYPTAEHPTLPETDVG